MKYKGFNILEIEKIKGIVYQLDMTIDGKRIRRNFATLQEAKDEADKMVYENQKNEENHKDYSKEEIFNIIQKSGIDLGEVKDFLKINEKDLDKNKKSDLLNSQIPEGKMHEKWSNHKFNVKLVNPANKRKYKILVVGTGLAGASAAATLAELGYQVESFTYSDSPRRAHSIAAQGGINAAKNYPNDGDSVHRLFYDTVKGGDYRSREANVHRLAEVSNQIIDHCVAQGIPFAREYGGGLDNRSFGGAQVSRTFYARGQTGQQLLLGAYGALQKKLLKEVLKCTPDANSLMLL